MWILSLFFGVLLVVCAFKADGDWYDINSGMGAAIAGVLSLGFIYLMNTAGMLNFADRVIQIIAIVVSLIVLLSNSSGYDCNISTILLLAAVVIFCGVSVRDFLRGAPEKTSLAASISENTSQVTQANKMKRGIEWDYENPEISIAEYSIMGVSGKELVVTVSYDGQNSLRSIPLDTVKVEFSDSVLTPYVYRKNYIYTEYNYRKNPPEVLRKDSEHWSDYILCGTKSQIQALFGYEENFNFEQ